MKRIGEHFVDFNDLRVSLIPEIAEVLGKENKQNRQIATLLTKTLRYIFQKYHVLTLATLQKGGKRSARRSLEKIEGVTDFAVDYCMLTAINSHVIPLTENMIHHLKENGLVYPDSDKKEIEGFLTRQISARNGFEFYTLLRKESENVPGMPKAKKKTQKKTKKKVIRKTKTRKKKKTKSKK